MLTLGLIVMAILGIMQGWSRYNRRHGEKHAPAEAARRYVERDEQITDAERAAMRRDEAKGRVRFR